MQNHRSEVTLKLWKMTRTDVDACEKMRVRIILYAPTGPNTLSICGITVPSNVCRMCDLKVCLKLSAVTPPSLSQSILSQHFLQTATLQTFNCYFVGAVSSVLCFAQSWSAYIKSKLTDSTLCCRVGINNSECANRHIVPHFVRLGHKCKERKKAWGLDHIWQGMERT